MVETEETHNMTFAHINFHSLHKEHFKKLGNYNKLTLQMPYVGPVSLPFPQYT